MPRTGPITRLGLIVVFTGIETSALAIWFDLSHGEPILSMAVTVGLGLLLFGLAAEHLLTDIAVNGRRSPVQVGEIIAFSVTETVLWGIWLVLVEFLGGVIAFGIPFLALFLLLVIQHGVEDHVLGGSNRTGPTIDAVTVVISLIETVGATVWLGLVLNPTVVEDALGGLDAAFLGLGVLAVMLFVEHLTSVHAAISGRPPE